MTLKTTKLNYPWTGFHAPNLKSTVGAFAVAMAVSFGSVAVSAQDDMDEEEVYDLEEFVIVSGIKETLLQGIDFKKDSYQMVDVIIAEDIGKFPDNNVVEALQRVSGIQTTDRAGGEVNTVTIRGLNDVTTTINGRDIFTASGRSVALADIPAALLNRVDVYKTRSADLIESGIAGVIDVQTQRPFYYDGFKSVLSARYTYTDLSDEWDPNLSAMISNVWDVEGGKFGALLNLSFAQTHYRDQNLTPGAMVPFMTDNPAAGWGPYERIFLTDGRVTENPIWQAGLEAGLPFNEGATLSINGVETPYVLSRDAIFQSQLNGERKRPAVNVSLQYAPEDGRSQYTFEAFYNGYRNKQFNSLLFSFVDWWGNLGDNPGANVELFPGTNIVKSRQQVNDVYTFNSGDQTESQTDSYMFAVTGEWEVGDDLNFLADLAYQTSKYETEFFAMRSDRVAQSINVDFNADDGIPAWAWPGNPEVDASLWNVGQLYDNANENEGSALNFKFQGEWTPESDFFQKVTFGVRFDNREASEAQRTSIDHYLGQSLGNFPEWQYTTSDFFDGKANVPGQWVVPNGWYIGDHKDEVRGVYQAAGADYPLSDDLSVTESFNITEKNYAAFIQTDFATLIGDNRLDGQIGARFVQYDTDMNFTDLDTLERSSADTSKSKVLPSLTLRYDITDNLRARFSYGQTIRRPNFVDLNAAITYVEDVTNIGYGTASGGNPDLDPTESTNYDLGLEYYFQEKGMVYGTWFKREIDGLVVDFRSRVNYEGYDYILSAPFNASDGELSGFEFGFTYFPDNLPDVLDGFGIQASYTILDSEQTIPVTADDGSITSWDTTPFFAVSDSSYSVVLAYEKQKFSARLSYVWRDDFLQRYESALFANPLGIFQRPEESMDFQLSYNVTEDFVITLDATNLTQPFMQRYYEYAQTHNFENALYSRTFSIGCRYAF